MAKDYSLGSDNMTIANAAATLVGFLPPAAPAPDFRIWRLWCSQSGVTTSAQYRIQVVTQVSAYPTVVTATPRPLKHADQVASLLVGVGGALTAGKCGVNASAEGAGAKTVMFGDNFNNINGWLFVPTPDEIIEMPSGDASSFGLFAPAAFTSNLSGWAAGVNFGER